MWQLRLVVAKNLSYWQVSFAFQIHGGREAFIMIMGH